MGVGVSGLGAGGQLALFEVGPATASGERVGRAIGTARAALEARAAEIDDLNVFRAAADGDTGRNMLATAAAVEQGGGGNGRAAAGRGAAPRWRAPPSWARAATAA